MPLGLNRALSFPGLGEANLLEMANFKNIAPEMQRWELSVVFRTEEFR